jgi:hypothetical protein
VPQTGHDSVTQKDQPSGERGLDSTFGVRRSRDPAEIAACYERRLADHGHQPFGEWGKIFTDKS